MTRMSMYVVPVSEKTVVAYLHGYDNGAHGKCGFTDRIRVKLETKYQIEYRACGWPEQIQRYAEKTNLDWLQAFNVIGGEVLNDESKKANKKKSKKATKR